MNEVRSTQITGQALVNSASSKGPKEVAPRETGKNLPPETVKAEKIEPLEKIEQANKPSISISIEELESAVANVSDYVQTVQRDIQFTVDEDLHRTVVKVIDSESGEVIRQIPDDIFLELARRLNDDGEFRLLNALG